MLGLKISHITIPLGHPGLDSSSESVRADRRAAQGRGCPNSTGVAWGVPGTHVAGPRPEVQTPGDRWGRLRMCVSDETPAMRTLQAWGPRPERQAGRGGGAPRSGCRPGGSGAAWPRAAPCVSRDFGLRLQEKPSSRGRRSELAAPRGSARAHAAQSGLGCCSSASAEFGARSRRPRLCPPPVTYRVRQVQPFGDIRA